MDQYISQPAEASKQSFWNSFSYLEHWYLESRRKGVTLAQFNRAWRENEGNLAQASAEDAPGGAGVAPTPAVDAGGVQDCGSLYLQVWQCTSTWDLSQWSWCQCFALVQFLVPL